MKLNRASWVMVLVALAICACKDHQQEAFDPQLDVVAVGLSADGTLPYTDAGKVELLISVCVADLSHLRADVVDTSRSADGGGVSRQPVDLLPADPPDGSTCTSGVLAATQMISHPEGGQFAVEVGAAGTRKTYVVPLADAPPDPDDADVTDLMLTPGSVALPNEGGIAALTATLHGTNLDRADLQCSVFPTVPLSVRPQPAAGSTRVVNIWVSLQGDHQAARVSCVIEEFERRSDVTRTAP